MRVGVPKETYPGEKRVAIVPGALIALERLGLEASIESGAGVLSGHPDDEYRDKGATIVDSRAEVFANSDFIAQVRSLGANLESGRSDLELLSEKHWLIANADPLGEPKAAEDIAQTGASSFALELIPRITRAQSMDVLSSMATIAGYKAVIIGADHLPQMFPMLMTAAGTLAAAKVFVIGCGVAGLQACATAKRLGAIVSAYDVRPAVAEQVQSVGAKFVEFDLETEGAEDKGGYAKEQSEEFIRRQQEEMANVVAQHDVVITTAAIPGRKSPVLVTEAMVQGMTPGSVIVDLASERGGNCELTEHAKTIEKYGVTIIGPENIPSSIPKHASQMFARNLTTFLGNMFDKEKQFGLDREDEIVAGTLVTHQGDVVHPRVRELLGLEALPAAPVGSDN